MSICVFGLPGIDLDLLDLSLGLAELDLEGLGTG